MAEIGNDVRGRTLRVLRTKFDERRACHPPIAESRVWFARTRVQICHRLLKHTGHLNRLPFRHRLGRVAASGGIATGRAWPRKAKPKSLSRMPALVARRTYEPSRRARERRKRRERGAKVPKVRPKFVQSSPKLRSKFAHPPSPNLLTRFYTFSSPRYISGTTVFLRITLYGPMGQRAHGWKLWAKTTNKNELT